MNKPLHKHIGHHAKNFRTHFTKYLYERDTIFATVWVFIFIFLLGSIPLNLGVINPIKLGLKDFDFNDIYYSEKKNTKNNSIDNRIVIINIGQADREGIALMIEKTASMKPKAMGLDVVFDDSLDFVKDSLLRETFIRHKNLVVAAKFQLDSVDKFELTRNYFKKAAKVYGYVNFPNEDKETTRYFFPFKINKDTAFSSFSSAIVKLYDTGDTVYHKLQKKGDSKVMINYTRNYNDMTKQYQVLDGERLLMENDYVDSAAIKGKIALLAYVNTNPNDIEDKKFTPMNEKFAGKSIPDMNGIFVHANIISMALDKNYVKKLPSWANWLIAIIICWLHMSFFIRYYLESHIWFHLVAKIAQVASAIFFVWLGIELFSRYRLKVDMKMSLIVIVLAVDVIYFYEAWAVWMHKKYKYHTVFKPHNH
jgi:CHASE2 domain-containing sensor protein